MAMYPIEACDLDLGKVVVGDDIYIHIRTANGEVADCAGEGGERHDENTCSDCGLKLIAQH